MLLNWLFLLGMVSQKPSIAINFSDQSLRNTSEYEWKSEHLLNGKNVDKNWWFFNNGSIYPNQEETSFTLFPEDKPGDRIIDQLMYIPFNYTVNHRVILINLGYVIWWDVDDLSYDVFQNCPVKRCKITKWRERVNGSDAIIIDSSYMPPDVWRTREQLWIFHSSEGPFNSKGLCNERDINWTMTYRLDSDVVYPYARWVYYDPDIREIPQERNYALGKTKLVAWFVSNCKPYNYRWRYAIELKKFIPVDIYGKCGHLKCPPEDPVRCQNLLEKDYKFYLSFENSNCNDYVTEKFFQHGLNSTVVPIVMGAKFEDYEKIAPEGSFIHIEEFPGPKQLAEYLKIVDGDDELYNSYFRWRGTGELLFETYPWCRLCAMLHGPRMERFYTNFSGWWQSGSCTTTLWTEPDHFDQRSSGSGRARSGFYVILAINLLSGILLFS